MIDTTTHIGMFIRKLRDQNNLSQKRFASRLGLSDKTISAYETGKVQPSITTIKKICQSFNVDLQYFQLAPQSRDITYEKLMEIQSQILLLHDRIKNGYTNANI